MRHQIRLAANATGIALFLTLVKWIIDIYIITQATSQVDFVFSSIPQHLILGAGNFVVTWRSDYKARYSWLSSAFYTWFILLYNNRHLIEMSYNHSPLTAVLLFLIAPLFGIPASFIGAFLGKIPRRFLKPPSGNLAPQISDQPNQ